MTQSKEEQVREVVEGLGLGLLAIDRAQVTNSKTDLESAFSRSWNHWTPRIYYPSFSRMVKPANEFWIKVIKSHRLRNEAIRWQKAAGTYAIEFAHQSLDMNYAASLIGQRTVSEWIAFAGAFADVLDELADSRH
ncbi:hypothetical protein [Brevibacterium casei]|uniref:hypothetical protein n=1 Tax=Brevibacterium casei TaxID=33889 RepID=UPI0011A4EEC4|nr:hypothetical protein [Brevibacterium casei]